jgi:hypothetical protein
MENRNDFIKLLPNDLIWPLLHNFTRSALRQFRLTDRENNEAVLDYSNRALPHIYFAVGHQLPLNKFINMNNNEIKHSLDQLKMFNLFYCAQDAYNWQFSSSNLYLDKRFDAYIMTMAPAVFVVSIVNPLFINEKSFSLSVLQSYTQRELTNSTTIKGFSAKVENLHEIYFSEFNKITFFGLRHGALKQDETFSTEFLNYWNQALSNENKDIGQLASDAVIKLFENYKSWYHVCRSHQQEVNLILEFIMKKSSVEDILQFLNSKRHAADNENINKEGRYYNMLSFSISKLIELKEVVAHPEMTLYLNRKLHHI